MARARLISAKLESQVQALEESLAAVLKQRVEFLEKRERILQEAADDHNKGMDNILRKTELELQAAAEAKRRAVERIRLAEEKTAAVERQSRELERQIPQLHAVLNSQLCEKDQRRQEMLRGTEAEVTRVQEDANHLVRNTSLFASEVQDGALSMIESMHRNMRVKVKEAAVGSAERSRFQELYNAMLSHHSQEISQEEFEKLRDHLLGGWLEDWNTSIAELGQLAPAPQLLPEDCDPRKLHPVSPERSRSVDRAREKTPYLRRLQQIHCIEGHERPQTAP